MKERPTRSPRLSITIPVFNEETRIQKRLPPYLNYLDEHLPDYEILLVDDGSNDGTLEVIFRLAREHKKIRVLTSGKNRGRGFGMRTGVLASQGEYILETDADLPVSPDFVVRFLSFLERYPEYDVLVGSRGLKESTFVLKQPLRRVFAGNVFHLIFGFLFDIRSRDVMCGFKMFRHEPAREIFMRVYDDRYLAAGEIVHVARKFGYSLKELPVAWEDNRESKVKIIRDSVRTLFGLAHMLWREWRGMYDQDMTVTFKEAGDTIKRASGRWSWPAIFTRIRFFTAPYFKLEQYVPEAGNIIDLGSGYGIFANLLGLLSKTRTVLGLDLDAYKSAHAKAFSPNVEFRHGDITKINVPPASCILLIHVLHHLNSYKEQEVLLASCFSKLERGGKLIICEIDNTSWWKLILTRIADFLLYPGDKIYYRFPAELLPILHALGGDTIFLPMHKKTPFSHITYIVTKS